MWILRDREKFDAQLEGNAWDFANLELGDDGESLGTSITYGSCGCYDAYIHMRVEQKVHERGFLCVSLWVCNEQSRLNFFLKWRKKKIMAKVLAKVHVDMSKFAL